jgi:hypothetical protein
MEIRYQLDNLIKLDIGKDRLPEKYHYKKINKQPYSSNLLLLIKEFMIYRKLDIPY